MRKWFLFVAASLAGVIPGFALEPQGEVQLTTVWCNCAKDARPLRDLEPELFVTLDTPVEIAKYASPEAREALQKQSERSLVLKLEKALLMAPEKSNAPKSAFAVAGVDRGALQGVFEHFVQGSELRDQFSANEEVTAVFFSRPSRAGISIERVEWQQHELRIHYELYSRSELSATACLALIPLGHLSAGRYQIEMIRAPTSDRDETGFEPVARDAEIKLVCASFEFTVVEAADF